MASKVIKEPFHCEDLNDGGIDESSMQRSEIHWFFINESPTKITLLPLSFSNNAVALNLKLTPKTFLKHTKIRTQRKTNINFTKMYI